MLPGEQKYAKYERRTPRSKKLYARAAKVFPGGISHNIRFFEPYPFFAKSAKGSKLTDVDGNKYTDYWMGHWALILGHSPTAVSSKLAQQARNGTLFGTVNQPSVELAEMIQRLMPGAEMMRFCSTGSEATMYAARLARAKKSRRVIAKAIGGWHGFNTTLMQTVNYPFEQEEGLGLVQDEGQFIESIPFNDIEGSLRVLETIKDDLAGVIIEPLLAGAGCIPPEDGYLESLQEFTQKNDSLFILDEIVTGFRLGLGGASERFGLDPDLFTLGKIAGGGMPIGVVCGKKEIMSLADPIMNADKESRCAVGGGTFSANPMTMTAGLATLDYLKRNGLEVYQKLDSLGDQARTGLGRLFHDAGISCQLTGIGSLFLTHFTKNGNQVKNAYDVATSDRSLLTRYHMALLEAHNIFFLPTKLGAFSVSHSSADVKSLVASTQKLIDSGLFKQTPVASAPSLSTRT